MGLCFISILVNGQKYETIQKTNQITEFKNRLFLSTSNDPMRIVKSKTATTNELAAQELVTVQTTKDSKLKSVILEGAGIDTTHSYAWDYTIQDWSATPYARMISTYDENHNLISYKVDSWQYEGQYWLDSLQFFYKYNSANQQVNAMQQSYQFDGLESYNWYNIDNSVTEYNELGQKSRFVYQTWDYEQNNWFDNWQHEFKYDEKGNNTIILESFWDGSQWNPYISFINEYDCQGNLITNPIQVWDFEANEWVNAVQCIYEYDSFGNNTYRLLQSWNSNEGFWENIFISFYRFNISNKIEYYINKTWDSFLYQWMDSEQGFYKYDSNGNNICIFGQYYDINSGIWSNSWQSIYTYNDQNKQISGADLYWSLDLDSWYSGSKTKSFRIGSDSKGENKHYVDIPLRVFPNPTSDYVKIYNTTIGLVRVLDLAGHEVLSKNYKGLNNVQMDISGLSSGTYFMIIQDLEGNSSTKKIVKI